MLRADGADLTVLHADLGAARVVVRLDLKDAGCATCVLPTDQLREVLAAALQRGTGTELEVVLQDPRAKASTSLGLVTGRDAPSAGVAPGPPGVSSGSGGGPQAGVRLGGGAQPGRIVIRVPVAEERQEVGSPAFTVDGPLGGLRVGLRHEGSWRSWMFIVSEWERFLRSDGASPVVLQTGERVGELGSSTAADVAAWTGAVDCGISGLGTCGSCTSWSVHDAASLEASGKPAVVAVCTEFVPHARNMARYLGHPDLKILELPYPLEARPEAELRQVALDYYPQFVRLLGVTT